MRIFFVFLTFILSTFNYAQIQHYNGKLVEGRAIYAYPPTDVKNDSSAKVLVENCSRANIHYIILLVKDPAGMIYFHSKKFQEAINPKFENFDALAAVVREAHKKGIKVHAWFCDFVDNFAFKKHPEWAVRNPEGKTTAESEYLGGGKKYSTVWMCPARRPGYADQWLIPMMVEAAQNYDVDGIHHDYVRYPGDVAPDSYCFDDYCLEHIPQYAHFYYQNLKDSIFPITPTLPKLIANWWSDPTVLPLEWKNWDRKQKADFLLNGSFVKGSRSDLDYFFYTYRADAVTNFVKEAWEKLHAVRPDIEISASVFKDPIESGRFIGQRWTNFAPYIDIMMPMVYRSHFPQTNFETFLKMFGEYVRQEYKWAKGKTNLSICIDAHYIYNEERLPPINAVQELDSLKNASGSQRDFLISEIKNNYEKIKNNLENTDMVLAKKIREALNNFDGQSTKEIKSLRELFSIINSNPPENYYPKEKLAKVIDTVRSAGGNGIAIFNTMGLRLRKLWPVVFDKFKEQSIEPQEITSGGELNVIKIKALEAASAHYNNLFTISCIIAVILLLIIIFLLFKIKNKKAEAA